MSVPSLVSWLRVYVEIGGVVALLLCATVGRLDPAARGAWPFRALLLPGATLLWPLVLLRIVGARGSARG